MKFYTFQKKVIFKITIIVFFLIISSCSEESNFKPIFKNKGFIKEISIDSNGVFKEKQNYYYDEKGQLSSVDYHFNSKENFTINVEWQGNRIIKMARDHYFQVFDYASIDRLEWIPASNWVNTESGNFQASQNDQTLQVIRIDSNPINKERNFYITDGNLVRITFLHGNGSSGESLITPSTILRPNFFCHDFSNKNDSFNQFLNLSKNCPLKTTHRFSDGSTINIEYTYETNIDNYPVKIIAKYNDGSVKTMFISYL